MPSIVFYISGHGFGHASRQIEIVNSLAGRLPDGWTIAIRTTAAPRLFERTVRGAFTWLPGETDTGVIQHDSLRLDEAATVDAAARFYATFAERVAAEAALLRQHGARLVVSDAPPLACAAASAAGIPSLVVSNFTWDWIYEGYADSFTAAPDVLPLIRDAYAGAAAGLRLPMHGGFGAIDPVEDVPFVARHARHSRAQVVDTLRLPADRPLVLASFGGFGVEGADLGDVDAIGDCAVVTTRWQEPDPLPRGVHCVDETTLYDRGLRYEDLVAAVDVVVTKPGYGIVSECIANDTAILYTSRGRFVEYEVIVREMPRYLRCRFIAQEDLLAGRWRATIDALLASPPPPERPRTDGAGVVAASLLSRCLR